MSAPVNPARSDELSRIAYALDRLTDRIESSETRTGLAISGVEHSVRHAVARIETAEREQMAVAARFDSAAERLDAEQARAAERLRRIETEVSGPRSAEALKALEQSVTRVATHLYENEGRTQDSLAGLEARLARAEAASGGDPSALIDDVVARLAERLGAAEHHTSDALESLRVSLAALDARLGAFDGAGGDLDRRLEGLAGELTRKVEDARNEIAEQLAATGGGQVEARLAQIADQVTQAEQRSAHAIEAMGREVLTMADTLSRRVQSAEQRSAEAIEQVGGEIARIAGAVENRLGRVDQLHAEALERLGGEIGKITERLTDRIIQSERRAAQAIDDVGEQVAKVTERIEQRHERASSDIAERIRQSEERTAKMLEEARAQLDLRHAAPEAEAALAEVIAAAEPQAASEAAGPTPEAIPVFEPMFMASSAMFGPELFSRAEPLSQPTVDPGNPAFGQEDFEAADAFAPIAETAEIAETEEAGPVAVAAVMVAEATPPDVVFAPDPNAPPPLSTREVIEQARAAARAAAAPRAKTTIKPAKPRPFRPGGLFSTLRARPPSTWQTALMVAGGAAFLSVGAAGVVLIEGPGGSSPSHSTQPLAYPPRAAVALTTPSLGAETPTSRGSTPSADATATLAASEYVQTIRDVEARKPGALARLKTFAEGDHTPAQIYLAKLYETGQAGVTLNLTEARRWTTRAAEAGDASAMHNLALYDFRGEGGPKDTAAAAQWFKKAAQRGVVDSQYNLALLYESGSGVPRDLAEAYRWFQAAANNGDGEARAKALALESKLSGAQLATAEAAAQPAIAAPVKSAAPHARPNSIVGAQRILGRLGYYKGRADGVTSHDLDVAVSNYQRDQGLAATGALDPVTVSRLAVFTR